MLTLSIATLDDAAVVARLMTAMNAELGPVHGVAATPVNNAVSADQARSRMQAMANVEEVLLALVDGRPAALLSLRIVPYLSQDEPYGEISELYVDPAHRRAGVATLLLAQAEFLARQRGCTYLHVNAWQNNDGAQALYRARGFAAVEMAFEKTLPPKSSSKRRRAEG